MKYVPYSLTVGSLMYAMVTTQPNLTHVIGVVSRFMHNLNQAHWNAVKHVFKYLVGTKDYDILFYPNKTSGIVGYTCSYFVGCLDSQKSTIGYFFRFGTGAIS